MSQAGAVGLVETVRVAGLDQALLQALAPWRKPQARHDPGKIVTDLGLSFGLVASDPTVLRLADRSRAEHRSLVTPASERR